MRVALYARVSTTNQSCDMQLETLRNYCLARCLEVTGEYVDIGISGAKSDRPELNRMMADAKQRKFDAILVWKLDRFARSLRHLVLTITDLDAIGVRFMSHQEGIDLSTPSGRLQFHILAAIAEFERSLIRERVTAGVAHCKDQIAKHGYFVRRPKDGETAGKRVTHWGRKPLAIDLSKIPEGMSIRDAAKLLNVNRESVRRALKAGRV